MQIIDGQTGEFQGVVTASDGSPVSTTNWSWAASDPSVTIVSLDPTGATVAVTVPASDTATTFNLTALCSATSTTESDAAPVTATVTVTIAPAPQPVTFSMTINQLS